MAILPVRDLGSVGVITDISPYNLPLNAFTTGINVRFDEGKVSRSAIFRTVKDNLGYTPRFVFGVTTPNDFDRVMIVSDGWYIGEYSNGFITNRSGSITGSNDPRAFTGTSLANVSYINRPDRVPVYRGPYGTDYIDLANWDATWRCNSLRSYKDFLIGLNMTEGLTNYSQRVRWSDITLANNIPASWSEFDTTGSAGFNDLVQIDGAIIDGQPLGDNFLIYSENQVWLMSFVGGNLLFDFRQLFTDAGAMNQNCVVQIEGQHYVFGPNDLYVTDGTSKRSICDERVKDFIFNSLNNQATDVCFVHHNPTLNEIHFCYQSGDAYAGFPNATRCNRSACYNYRNNTFSFVDLPNVTSGTIANVNMVATYANITTTYAATGGTYLGQEDSYAKHTLFVGESLVEDGITSDKLYGVDLSDEGQLAFPLDTQATKPILLERTGLDLDEAGLGTSQYVVCTRIYPQANTTNTSNTNVTFQVGAGDIPSSVPTYSSTTTYNLASDHKIDSRAAGRYLSYKMTLPDTKDFELSGFDLEVTSTGRR